MIEIVYKENKEQANGNEGYFHLPKNIRQVGDTNGRERIYLEDYVGTFLKKYFSAPEGRAAMLFGEFKWADGISYFFIRSAAALIFRFQFRSCAFRCRSIFPCVSLFRR